jgi:hypothetical protein
VKAVPEALPEDHMAILPTPVEAHPTVAVADLHPQAQEALLAVVLQDRTEEGNFKTDY